MSCLPRPSNSSQRCRAGHFVSRLRLCAGSSSAARFAQRFSLESTFSFVGLECSAGGGVEHPLPLPSPVPRRCRFRSPPLPPTLLRRLWVIRRFSRRVRSSKDSLASKNKQGVIGSTLSNRPPTRVPDEDVVDLPPYLRLFPRAASLCCTHSVQSSSFRLSATTHGQLRRASRRLPNACFFTSQTSAEPASCARPRPRTPTAIPQQRT